MHFTTPRDCTFSAISSSFSFSYTLLLVSPCPLTRVEDTTQSDKQIYFRRCFALRENHGLKKRGNRGLLHNTRENARTRRFHFSRKLNSPLALSKRSAKPIPVNIYYPLRHSFVLIYRFDFKCARNPCRSFERQC